MMTSVTDKIANITEKGGNAGYQHFLLFPKCFHKHPLSVLLKLKILWSTFKTHTWLVPDKKKNSLIDHFTSLLTMVI